MHNHFKIPPPYPGSGTIINDSSDADGIQACTFGKILKITLHLEREEITLCHLG